MKKVKLKLSRQMIESLLWTLDRLLSEEPDTSWHALTLSVLFALRHKITSKMIDLKDKYSLTLSATEAFALQVMYEDLLIIEDYAAYENSIKMKVLGAIQSTFGI